MGGRTYLTELKKMVRRGWLGCRCLGADGVLKSETAKASESGAEGVQGREKRYVCKAELNGFDRGSSGKKLIPVWPRLVACVA